MENSPRHNSVAGHQITTNFLTFHYSTAVVPCTDFCSDHGIRAEVRVKRIFHWIWIAMEKPLVKRCPGLKPLPCVHFHDTSPVVQTCLSLSDKIPPQGFTSHNENQWWRHMINIHLRVSFVLCVSLLLYLSLPERNPHIFISSLLRIIGSLTLVLGHFLLGFGTNRKVKRIFGCQVK